MTASKLLKRARKKVRKRNSIVKTAAAPEVDATVVEQSVEDFEIENEDGMSVDNLELGSGAS